MSLQRVLCAGVVCSTLATAAVSVSAQETQQQPPQSAPAVQNSISTGAKSVQTGGTRVHGAVTDPDGAFIPGAVITFTPTKGSKTEAKTGKSGSDGSYAVSISPGTYSMTVTMPGFASYVVQNMRVTAVAAMTMDVKMQVGTNDVVVNVDANEVQLSVDPDSNASATVLQGKDLEALSDDPDELESQLEALAGPSAGPNGGQIYVDGFTGGQLPPKSQIREIRINQNPFSAQYDRLGFGRVEVFTKPGTDKFHGQFQLNYDPSQFNSPNPLSTANQPSYHTLFMFGSITGPLSKKASFNVSGSHRDIEDNQFTNAIIPVATAGSTTYCQPGTGCTATTSLQEFTHYPQIRTDISPRFDFALGEKNVLTTRFQYVKNDRINLGIGNIDLPENGYNTTADSFEFQASDTQTWSPRLINETRFEWERERTADKVLNTAPQLTVSGSFTAGGATTGNISTHLDHFEVQNYTSLAMSKHFIRLGGRLRSDRNAVSPFNNINGSFTYASIAAYAAGTPTQFSQNVVLQPSVRATVSDLGVYAEDDWKVRPNLTFSYGFRYETQNHLSDHHDFAPRLSFAYGVPGKKGSAPKTVIRGGMGFFYDRFSAANVLSLNEYSPTSPVVTQYTITNFTGITCTPGNITGCTTGAAASATAVVTRIPNLRTPYNIEYAFGFDQQLTKYGKVSANYIHTLGLHQLVQQNVNYPTNGSLPAVGAAINDQFFSMGAYHQDQLNINAQFRTTRWLSLNGYYSLGFAKGDASGAASTLSTPYNIQADYGRTTFDTRSRGMIAGSITLPRFIQLSPFIIAQSGSPYNITVGNDRNGDGFLNDRAYAVPNGTAAATGSTVKSIAGCGTFTNTLGYANESLAPINSCTGPALFTTNFRLTKTWGFGGSRTAQNNREDGGGRGQGGYGQGPGGGGGNRGGGGGGRGPGGGGPGGFGGGGGSTGQKYNVGIGVTVNNLFNNTNLATPNGTLLSSLFGQSTQLEGGPYTGSGSVRRIQVQASFNF